MSSERRLQHGPSTHPDRPVRRFELLDALSGGGPATAKVRLWADPSEDYVTTGIEFEVYDADEKFSGGVGDFGLAQYFADSKRWEVIRLLKGPIPFTNVSGETMPAHAVGLVTGIDSDGVLQVEKFTTTNLGTVNRAEVIISLSTEDVDDDGSGACVYLRDITPEHPVQALYYDDGSGDSPEPAAFEVWGPIPGQWGIWQGAPGLVILGNVDTDNKLVQVKPQDEELPVMARFTAVSSGTTVPAFSALHTLQPSSIGMANNSDVYPVYDVRNHGGSYTTAHLALPVFTGPESVAKWDLNVGNGYCQAHLGVAKPIVVTTVAAHGVARGDIVGPIHDRSELFKGIPGFVVLDDLSTTKAIVIRDPRRFGWAKVTGDWSRSGSGATEVGLIPCRPVTSNAGTTAYDGASSDYPSVTFNVRVKTFGQLDPITRTDDLIQYYFDGSEIFAVTPVLGARLLTVQLWSGSASAPPRGWALMDGTANATGNGGSGFDMRGRFPVCYHGSQAAYDTVGETGTFGTTGTNYNYMALPFIERIR